MVPNQLIVAVVLKNILQAGHGDQAHSSGRQVVSDAPQHHSRLRLMFQEIKGEEYVVGAARYKGVFCLRKSLLHVQAVLYSRLHQILPVLYAVDLHREFPQHREKLSTAAACLQKFLSFQMIGLYEMAVLPSAKIHHGGGESAGPDHVPVIVHRLTVKLYQAAVRALAEIQCDPVVLLHLIPVRNILGGRRHVIQSHQRLFRQFLAAGNTLAHKSGFLLVSPEAVFRTVQYI